MESDDTTDTSDTQRLIDAVVADDGSTFVRADDVATTALDLADRLDADLVEGASALAPVIAEREQVLADRVAAHTALELTARSDASGDEHVVTDVETLRRLVERIDIADRLVAASHEAAQSRAMAVSDLAVHPTSIRAAADDVLEARAALEARRTAVAELDRADASDEPDRDGDADRPDDETSSTPALDAEASDPDEPRQFDGWQLTDAGALRTPALVVAVALVIGVLALVLTGSPLALVIPGLAVCWVVVLVVRQRDDAYDAELASRNLANVTRLTDQAYGGVDAVARAASDVEDPERQRAQQAVLEAENRLAFAEASWRSLVGPDAEVDDVESVLMANDARYGLGDHAVQELPAVRTADAHRRRLVAQWKVAWWALDRPVPPVEEADGALTALAGEGRTTITIPTRPANGLSVGEQERLDELAAGRSDDELRAAAAATVAPVVIADEDGGIGEEQFRAATAHLPDDVRVVVVVPAE